MVSVANKSSVRLRHPCVSPSFPPNLLHHHHRLRIHHLQRHHHLRHPECNTIYAGCAHLTSGVHFKRETTDLEGREATHVDVLIVFVSRLPPRPFGIQFRSVLRDCNAVCTGVQVLVQACRDAGRAWVRTAVKVIGCGFVCSVVAGGAQKIAVP